MPGMIAAAGSAPQAGHARVDEAQRAVDEREPAS
jgi:hypothetical protein